MSKPFLLFQGPVATRSGYGDHSRDLLASLFKMDKYDIKVIPTRWGNTPQNQLNPQTEIGKKIIESVVTQVSKQPDVYIQVTVANEFRPIGKYNIGITAGVETTVAPKSFIDGCNLMDLIIVPSRFTKTTLENTSYDEKDKRTGQLIAQHKISKPIEVLHEGVELEKWQAPKKVDKFLEDIKTDFNYLVVGHWLQGDLGQDRKDIGMTIKTFCTVFKDIPKKDQPGLILKTSTAGFSVMDRENISKNIGKTNNFEYQVTNIMEINSKKFKSIGFALMDGPFFSFLPMGNKKNTQVLYHVTHSVLKKSLSDKFKYSWLKKNKVLRDNIKRSNSNTLQDLKKYFPSMDVKKINKNYISSRVLLPRTKKTAKRISYLTESSKNYFEIFSGKVDHSVDIANKLYKRIYKILN